MRMSIALGMYVACWLVAYVAVNQDLDLGIAARYFLEAWSFGGFARQMYVWYLSLGLFVVIGLTVIYVRRTRDAKSHLAPNHSLQPMRFALG